VWRPTGSAKPKGASSDLVLQRRDRNGSDDGARPRGLGSEQPPRASVTDVGGETRFTVPGVKGEEARFAVKGRPAMVAPVMRTHGVDRHAARQVDRHRSCRRGEGSEGQSRRREEARFATGRNHGEPQDRQQGETNLHGRRGTNRRGGAKPRGRHVGEAGCLSPKGTRRRVPGHRTLRLWTMEGRSLETPREAVRPARSDREDRDATGKSASRSGGAREACQEVCRAPDRRDLEGHGARASKVEEGSGEANSRGSDRGTPPVDRPLAESARTTRNRSPRESAAAGRRGRWVHPPPWPLGVGRTAERSATSL